MALASDYEVKRIGATTEIKELRVEDIGYKIGQYEVLMDEVMEDIDNENTLEVIMTYRDYTTKARRFNNYEFYKVKDCEGSIIVNKQLRKITVKNYKRFLSLIFEKNGIRVLLVGYLDETKEMNFNTRLKTVTLINQLKEYANVDQKQLRLILVGNGSKLLENSKLHEKGLKIRRVEKTGSL